MGSPFRSFGAKPLNGQKRIWSEEEVLLTARQLLEEHAASREAATAQHNLVCGNCRGAGNTPSTLMPGEVVTCFACAGSGKPNDAVQALPELSPEDNERMWQLRQLLVNFPKYRPALLALYREAFPLMYRDGSEGQPN